ncbi:hypothetical protein SLS58_008590 [Diplodia intermedia]|uniref:C-type lectin domain-containing protein n=1 Tax=Diplodia intermedia TaxID=856260 RepID=A0ABR3TH67_9PEZI
MIFKPALAVLAASAAYAAPVLPPCDSEWGLDSSMPTETPTTSTLERFLQPHNAVELTPATLSLHGLPTQGPLPYKSSGPLPTAAISKIRKAGHQETRPLLPPMLSVPATSTETRPMLPPMLTIPPSETRPMLPPTLTPAPSGSETRPTLPPVLSTKSSAAGGAPQATCGSGLFQERFKDSNHTLVALDREAAAEVMRQLQYRNIAGIVDPSHAVFPDGGNTRAGSIWITMDAKDAGGKPWARVEVTSPREDLPALPRDGKLTSAEMAALQSLVEVCGGTSGGRDASGRIVGADGRTWELFAEQRDVPAPPPAVETQTTTTTETKTQETTTAETTPETTLKATRTVGEATPPVTARTWSWVPKPTGELDMTFTPPVRGLPLPKPHLYREAERVCRDEGANVLLPGGGKFVHEQQAMDRQMMDSIFYRLILVNQGTEPYVVKQPECKKAFWKIIDECANANGMFGGWRKEQPDLMFIIQDANSRPKDRYRQPKNIYSPVEKEDDDEGLWLGDH